MSNKFGKDLTSGSVPRHLLAFSVPMLLGNLLNAGYSIINTMWVGNILGGAAVGATAVGFPIIFLLIAIASGATMATSILVSQYYGAKDYAMLRRVVNNSFALSMVLALVLGVAGFLLTDTLLGLMGTPQDVFFLASGYLKISFAGTLFFYLSFLLASILRGTGDTVTPLAFLAISTVVNAILDPLLIIGVFPFPKMGINGAALASVIAQFLALVLGFMYLNRKNPMLALRLSEMRLDRDVLAQIFTIGFPSMVQQSLVAMGSVFITRFINGFGASAIAAFGAVSRIDALAMMPAMSISMAASSLTGQNLGANKPERIREIFRWGILFNFIIGVFFALFAVAIPRVLLTAFIHAPVILDIGVQYLRIVAIGYVFSSIMFVTNGIINGSGRTVITMLITLLSLWFLRVPLAAWLSHTSIGLTGIWIAITVSFGISMLVSLGFYFSGLWKKAPVARPQIPPMATGELI